MSKRKSLIRQLEDQSSELAKEILLNEASVYEAEKEMQSIDEDLLDHSEILNYFNNLRFLIERIEKKNQIYKAEIFENELKIQKLKGDD